MTYPVEYIRDIPYGQADGPPLLLDIVRPVGAGPGLLPAIVQIHGGGWHMGEKEPDANRILAAHGFFTVSINYRLSPQYTFPAHLEDCKAAVRWLRAEAQQYSIDASRIGVWGGSAGGHLAALLGTSGDVPDLEGTSGSPGYSTRVQAVVSICGASDLSRAWPEWPDRHPVGLFGGPLKDHAELVQRANPIRYITPDVPPFLLIHGTDDEISPFSQSELLDEALRAAGGDVTFVRAEGERHSFSQEWQDRIEQLRLGFFKRHLS
jgi:acetyl esterase/lipase